MATNTSAKEKTLLNMLQTMSSNIWNIDNLTTMYNYNNSVIIQNKFILDDYVDYFEAEANTLLEEVTIDPKYFYCPTMFSEYYYGTPDLDFLVMYFAKITTLFEFNKSKITCLKPEFLKEINKLMVLFKDKISDSHNNPELITPL